MSNELATRTQGMQIHSVNDLARVSEMFASSGYFSDARDAAQAGVKILAGQGWGIAPFDAMTGIHIIQGRATIGAHLIAAKIKASGKYDYRVKTMTDKACEVEFYQGSQSIGISSFTIDEAKKAGTKNLDKFARNMLFARAMSNGYRWYCPDVFTGPVYTPEELGATVDGDGNVITAEATPSKSQKTLEPTTEPNPEPVETEPTADDDGEFPPEPPEGLFGEASVTAAQLKALHTRLTKLGFNGKTEHKELARGFIGHLVGRNLGSSKDLTKAEAHAILDASDDELTDQLDAFNASRQLADEDAA